MIPTHHRRRQLFTSLPWPLRFILLPLWKQKGWQAFAAAIALLLLLKYKACSFAPFRVPQEILLYLQNLGLLQLQNKAMIP